MERGEIKLTRGKIEYNFKISPFRILTDYYATFVFSSESHKIKFIERQKKQREKISESLSNRFNFVVECNIIADILLYREIEKRGFLIITDEGIEIECQNSIKLGGQTLTKRQPVKK